MKQSTEENKDKDITTTGKEEVRVDDMENMTTSNNEETTMTRKISSSSKTSEETTTQSLNDRITQFYQKYNSDRLDSVPQLVKKYTGNESALFKALVEKYGPEPKPGEIFETEKRFDYAGLLKKYKNCRASQSWFAKPELYDETKNGPTILVNNSNSNLDFGGGGTNGAIRDFFWPEHSKFMWFFPAGSQPWYKWKKYGQGLFESKTFRKGKREQVFESTSWYDRPDASPGNVYYTPIDKARTKGTSVVGIVQAVGPINARRFNAAYRNKCMNCVSKIVKECLLLAHHIKAKNLVISGISAGIFARGDAEFSSSMRRAILQSLKEYFESTKEEDQICVTIVGRDWDDC